MTSLSKIIITLALLGATTLSLPPTSAQAATLGSKIFLSNARQTATYIVPGQSTSLIATITNQTHKDKTVIVVVEIYDASINQVYQTQEEVVIPPTGTRNVIAASPITLGVGTYTWALGIYSKNGKRLINWYNPVQTFYING